MSDSLIASTILEAVFGEAIKRIIGKVKAGKRLSDSEITLLLLGEMNRRIDDIYKVLSHQLGKIDIDLNNRIDETNKSLNKRIDDVYKVLSAQIEKMNTHLNNRINETNKRIDDLRIDVKTLTQEVSSIKSVIINLLKEKISKK